MRIKTISGPVSTTVTLGAGGYSHAITITDTGSVAPNVFGADAIVAPAGLDHAKIINQGRVAGGDGAGGNFGGAGGIGIDLVSAADVINQNGIYGGSGGYGFYVGGKGGAGLVFESAGHLRNTGTVAGGAGHASYSSYGQGGAGGVGVQLGAGVLAQNGGTIDGGAGGNFFNQENGAYGYAGQGGAGVVLTGAADLSNDGTIQAGAGGQYAPFGADGFYYGTGGNGGIGVVAQSGGVIDNSGTIIGGGAGGSLYSAVYGGDGVDLLGGGRLTNSGLIVAGVGGKATDGTGAGGGSGVYLVGGTLTNMGTIAGGAGGSSYFQTGGVGGAGVFIDGGTLITSGTIMGGAGGSGNSAGVAGAGVQFGSVAGTLVVDPGAVFIGGIAGDATVADTLVLAGHALGTLSGFGASVTGLNDIVVGAHAHWLLAGAISGSGSLLVDAGARVTLNGAVSIGTIAFGAGGGETVQLDTPGTVSSVFAGFATGDVIGLANVQAASLSFSHGTLSLFDAGGTLVDKLDFAGKYTKADFALRPDGHGTDIVYAGTEVSLPAWHFWPGR